MTEDNHAGSSENGESENDEKKKKSASEDFVPVSQMKAALRNQGDKHGAEMDELRTRLSKVEKPSEDEKTYTRSDLTQLVNDNHISQEQADLRWDQQLEAKFDAKAIKVSKEVVQDAQRNQSVEQDIARYIALEPDLEADGTDLREKVHKEFRFLVDKMGDSPKALTTELKALRAVLGPIEPFELAKKGKSSHESHQETGGDLGGGEPKGKSFKDSLSEQKRVYYQKHIDSGIYKDWDAVKEELKYAKKKAA